MRFAYQHGGFYPRAVPKRGFAHSDNIFSQTRGIVNERGRLILDDELSQ